MLPLILAAVLASAPQSATIVNHAAPSAGGYTIVVRSDAGADISTSGPAAHKTLSVATVAALFQNLASAGPLDAWNVRHCAKTMSGGGRLSVTYGGVQSPGDLSCGGDANVQAILVSIRAIEKEAGIAPAPTRRFVPSAGGATSIQ